MSSTLFQAVVSALSEGACPVLEELELAGWDHEDKDGEQHTLQAKVHGLNPPKASHFRRREPLRDPNPKCCQALGPRPKP